MNTVTGMGRLVREDCEHTNFSAERSKTAWGVGRARVLGGKYRCSQDTRKRVPGGSMMVVVRVTLRCGPDHAALCASVCLCVSARAVEGRFHRRRVWKDCGWVGSQRGVHGGPCTAV